MNQHKVKLNADSLSSWSCLDFLAHNVNILSINNGGNAYEQDIWTSSKKMHVRKSDIMEKLRDWGLKLIVVCQSAGFLFVFC